MQRGTSSVCTSSPTLAPSAMGNEAPEKASCNAGVACFRLGITWEWATVLSPEIWGQRVQLERRKVCSKCSGEVRLRNWVPDFTAVQLRGCIPTLSGSQRPRKPVAASLLSPPTGMCVPQLFGNLTTSFCFSWGRYLFVIYYLVFNTLSADAGKDWRLKGEVGGRGSES